MFHEKEGPDVRKGSDARQRQPAGGDIVEISARIRANKVSSEVHEREERVQKPRVAAPPAVPSQVVEVGQVLEVPTKLIKPLEDQPRTYFGKSEINSLAASIAVKGQVVTVSAVSLPDGTYRISDGERRWRACRQLKRPLRIEVVPELPSHADEVERSAVANFHRVDHTPLEKAMVFKYLRENGRSVADIARKFGVTPQTVYNYLLLLDKLDPGVIDLMDPVKQGGTKNLLGMTVAVALTPFYEKYREGQVKLARHIVSRKLKLQQALRLIATRATELGIRTGRGRERKGSDYMRILNRLLDRLDASLEQFAALSDDEFGNLFAFSPAESHRRVSQGTKRALRLLTVLQERLAGVTNPGCKRKRPE